jgi:hypothetical protein
VRVNPPDTHRKKSGDIFEISLARCMITPSSVMMKRTLFLETGGFNESLPAAEDYDLWLRICARHPVDLIEEPLLTRFGGRPDQLSATVMGLDRFRIRSLLDLLSSNLLSAEQRILAKTTLFEKATIVAQGSLKRGKSDEHQKYTNIATFAQSL